MSKTDKSGLPLDTSADDTHNDQFDSLPLDEDDSPRPDQQECRYINMKFLPYKCFYFFYFAANGTLMPYLILFFKQLGLSPSQVGIIAGMKPFIAFIFVPLWGCIADKTGRTRIVFVIAMLAYISGYLAYSFAPAKHVCLRRSNQTHHTHPYPLPLHNHGKRGGNETQVRSKIKTPVNTHRLAIITNYDRLVKRRSLLDSKKMSLPKANGKRKAEITFKHFSSNDYLNLDVNDKILSQLDSEERFSRSFNVSLLDDNQWSVEYRHHNPWSFTAACKVNAWQNISNFNSDFKQDDVEVDTKPIFSYLLIVNIVSTVFSCPALTIADTATVRKLKEDKQTHKYGKQRLWGSLGWGLTAFGVGAAMSALYLCPGVNNEVNYYPAFYIFAILLFIAMLIGLKLKFKDEFPPDEQTVTSTNRKSTSELISLICQTKYVFFVLTSFFFGLCMSLIRTFLFWYLKDIGGTQLLFSIIPAVNCVAEVFMYFYSSVFIKKVGHVKVLYLALLCYAIRLFYYGLLPSPWYALAVEPLSGITTAAAWASMISYIGLNAPEEVATSMQGK